MCTITESSSAFRVQWKREEIRTCMYNEFLVALATHIGLTQSGKKAHLRVDRFQVQVSEIPR